MAYFFWLSFLYCSIWYVARLLNVLACEESVKYTKCNLKLLRMASESLNFICLTKSWKIIINSVDRWKSGDKNVSKKYYFDNITNINPFYGHFPISHLLPQHWSLFFFFSMSKKWHKNWQLNVRSLSHKKGKKVCKNAPTHRKK